MQLASEFELEGDGELEYEEETESLFGAGEFGEEELETEWAGEAELELELELEDGEEFFGGLRKIGRGLLSVAEQVPWRAIAKTVAPMAVRRSADPSAACWVRQRRHCSKASTASAARYSEYERRLSKKKASTKKSSSRACRSTRQRSSWPRWPRRRAPTQRPRR